MQKAEDYFEGMSEEEIKDYNEAQKRIQEEEIEQYSKDQAVLEIVREQVSKEDFECIEFAIEESEHTSEYRILDAPVGKIQKADGIEEWVDQHAVGDSGDSWCGTVCVKLPNGKYLAWNYSIW